VDRKVTGRVLWWRRIQGKYAVKVVQAGGEEM
jgi:hypothetical protein